MPPAQELPVADRAFFTQIPVFAGLPDRVVDRVARFARIVPLKDGQRLYGEGDQAKSMFVVREGELEICKQGRTGVEFCVATLKAGDCVGEMSLVDIQPRSATVRARGATVLFAFDQSEVGKLRQSDLEAYSLLVLNIAREISRRLRFADQMLVDVGLAVDGMWRTEPGADGGGPGGP